MRNQIFTLFCLFILVYSSKGQSIEGKISDETSGQAISNASVAVNGEPVQISDESGRFYLDQLPPGLVDLTLSCVGYETKRTSSVWVKNGKTTYMEITLTPSRKELDEVVVLAKAELLGISAVKINEEKVNRYAATYYDPARLVAGSSDALVTNDQNNQISVRGLNPAYNVWRLEGLEITNPNHLSNAGIFNDQPAASSGGVNILSAQMLDDSEFYFGAMNSGLSNTVGGLFDMNLRQGYNQDHQFTAQASLIGFDFSAEGPLIASQGSSYLLNYRYSFTGLLGEMGVDFGGETIAFQDLAVSVDVPLRSGGKVKIFSLVGISSNDFKVFPLEESEIEKHRSDILFKAKMGAMGFRYDQPLGQKVKVGLASAISSKDESRDQTRYSFTSMDSIGFRKDQIDQTIWSNHIYGLVYFGRPVLTLGSRINAYHDSYNYLNESVLTLEVKKTLIAPYADLSCDFNPRLKAELGVGSYHLSREGEQENALDYRANLNYRIFNFNIAASAGRYSQIFSPLVGYLKVTDSVSVAHPDYDAIGLISSSRYTLSLGATFGSLIASAEGFYYHFDRINGNWYGVVESTESIQGRTQGIALRISQKGEKFYYDGSASFFNSTFDDGMDNPFNAKTSLNFLAGRNWKFSGGEFEKVLSVNIKGIYQGGLYQYSENPAMTGRLGNYARFDLRVQWIKYRPKSTHSFALDIQNLTNRENEAYWYFDNFTGQVETSYQLEMIPILTYRVEF